VNQARESFQKVQQLSVEVDAQEQAVKEARLALERETEKLKAAKLTLAAAWSQLEQATSHATVYNIDGQMYMRWVGHNDYPTPKLVLITGFAIPPAGASEESAAQ
jgi:hypothetical protein